MKDRKLKIFLVFFLLIQYYFAFGMLTEGTWFNASIWIVGLYFGANVTEGAIGKEKLNA